MKIWKNKNWLKNCKYWKGKAFSVTGCTIILFNIFINDLGTEELCCRAWIQTHNKKNQDSLCIIRPQAGSVHCCIKYIKKANNPSLCWVFTQEIQKCHHTWLQESKFHFCCLSYKIHSGASDEKSYKDDNDHSLLKGRPRVESITHLGTSQSFINVNDLSSVKNRDCILQLSNLGHRKRDRIQCSMEVYM